MTTETTNQQRTAQLLHDVFVTAMEGGVQYWADVDDYHWSLGKPDFNEDLEGFHAILTDNESDPPVTWLVSKRVMRRGWTLARSKAWRSRISWNCETPPIMLTEDGWDHDAGDADVIVQLGLFGDVIYG